MEMAPAQVLARFSTFLASASVAAAYEVKWSLVFLFPFEALL
jgi:hypothetical protein